MNPEGEAIVCLCHNPVRHSRGNAAGAPDSTIRATDLGAREPREVMLPRGLGLGRQIDDLDTPVLRSVQIRRIL
jgi:hypothetical protein